MERLNMKKSILMTGITGFMGSAMAASFIRDLGAKIYFLSNARSDREKAIKSITNSFNYDPLRTDIDNNFEFLYCEDMSGYDELKQTIGDRVFDEIWHIAAYMSYDPLTFNQSINFNSVASATLMKATLSSGRFYFISTTGVAGAGEKNVCVEGVKEELIEHFQATNPYTVSKILAEYMLFEQSKTHNAPLTIIRPGSIIGDSDTGWVNETKYGYYSYLHVLKRFLKKNITFYLDIDPDKKFPVIHINHLVNLCNILRIRENNTRPQEIFHACNGNLMTAREHFRIFEAVGNGNITIDYGEGIEGYNKIFNAMNKDNNKFLGVKHCFNNDRLIESIGVENLPPNLSMQSLKNVIEGYIKK
jgi:nucleoside-diphosphate-sugar epimerase